MKKIVLLLVVIVLLASQADASSFNAGQFSNFFNRKTVKTGAKNVATDTDNLTKSEQATIYYNDNDAKKAFDTIISIKESERNAQDWVLLGNILQDQEKISDAMFMYQKAINVEPKNYKAYYNLGNLYLDEEKPNLAIENYRKANKLNNKFPYAYYNLGCAYLQLGELKKAKIVFLKAIELKNTVPEFHYNLAYTYKKLNNQKLAKQYLSFYNKLMENNQ